jgi:hypothetical protein
MDKLGLKKKLLEACRSAQQDLVETLRNTSLQRVKNIADSPASEVGNAGEIVWQEEMASVQRQASQAEVAQQQLQLLETMHIDHLLTQVEWGAVVLTDVRNFFVSTSLTDITVNGTHFLGIALESDIYQELKGKKKGDEFRLNGQVHRISDVF